MDADEPEGVPDISEGGDPACWLALLCPECGAVLESRSDPCWRCGLRPGDVHA